MIKVFHAPHTRSLRILWVAEELGLACEVVPIEMRAPRPAEFLEINPSGSVPAMRDGEVMMTESVAILQYMADRHAGGALTVKPDQANYADYLQFLFFGEAGLSALMNAVVVTALFGPEDQKDNWTCKAVMETIDRRLPLVERQLARHAYVAGDDFTLADIAVAYPLGVMSALLGQADRIPPAVMAYYERLKARPAYQRAAAI